MIIIVFHDWLSEWEVSDYLLGRLKSDWMHDVLVACQELEQADVESYRSGRCSVPVASPADPSSLKAMVTVHDMDQDQPFAAPAEVSVSIAVAVDGEHVADKSLSSIAVAVGGEHVV